jgi:hypothetical protein
MGKKVKTVLVVLVMLSLAGSAHAYVYSWCSTSGDWGDSARWDAMPSPAVEGQALIYNGAVLDVTTAGQGAWDCAIGYDTGGGTVNIPAGIKWDVSTNLMVGHGNTGVLNVNGTARSGGLQVTTGVSSTTSGTVNVNSGGLLKVGLGGWAIGIGQGAAGGCINLNGSGSMVIDGDGGWHLDLYGGRGHIDIESGSLKVVGDRRTELQGYVDNGWITGYDNTGTINAPVTDGSYTVVTAIPEPTTMILLGFVGLLLRKRMA